LLNQRNRLLKNLRQKIFQRADKMLQPEELMQLETWDHALSGSMSRLIRRRQEYTARISEIAARAHQSISSGQETLGIRYRTITGLRPEMDDQETQQLIAEKLRATMADDIEKGVTGIGPHRDDLEISLNGESLKPYASQGQQRSAVLSMKLAELEIIRLDTGELPVLLLDDVMSELDIIRRHSLLAGIEQAQVLLTCTDKDQVNRQLEGATSDKFSYYEVSKGTVINEEPEAREKTI
jgi:DNA replication and repair protein RecF